MENAESSSGVRLERAISPRDLSLFAIWNQFRSFLVILSKKVIKKVPTLTRTDTKDSVDRDAVLARVESEKKQALIKAWEESEKTKAENRAYKRHNAVVLWENSKKASAEANLKRIEEKLDRNKAKCVEKMQNKVAEIHRTAEEKRAMIEAYKGEEFLEIEEKAVKLRTRGHTPRKFLPCFGS
ncbi:remorin 1.4 isoform X1 [Cajanus cajan]|uniref:remorin 1.4 isoform X1 n=1 Tax=Cajanus cajan TaxID=3821 RepID=UPI00098DA047|nr:remorin 1.4 isoform X1 [Cajanus cajan]